MNIYLQQLFQRHEARKLLLPRMGFKIPDRPSDFQIHDAATYRVRRTRRSYLEQRRSFDEAMGEVERLQIPVGQQYDWLKQYRPDAMPLPISGGIDTSYIVYNSSLATTAAPVKQPTGSTIRTMTQLKAGAGQYLSIAEWGCSFDASAAAQPGQVELFETTVAATMSTAYVNADIQRFGNANGPQQGDTANLPIDVTGTATSGFATTAVTEGTVANYRCADLQLVPPTNPYLKQWPLGREFQVKAGNFLRSRMTFGATVNCYIYVVFIA